MALLVFLLALSLVNGDYNVSLEEVSSVFLPTTGRVWDYKVVQRASYDADNKILYVVGGLSRFVIDMKTPSNLAPVRADTSQQGNVEYTDISCCGNYFIQTTHDIAFPPNGTVKIFKKFDASRPTEEIYSAQVGENPSSVKFLPGCRTAIVTVKGSAYKSGSDFIDPKGKVLLVRLPGARYPGSFASNVDITALDFTKFDDRVNELLSGGARFVYRDRHNNFSNDVDPSKITVTPDGKTAYIGLQRTNAVAVLDVRSGNIVSIRGLGLKTWRNLFMDASDQDGGINMREWPIYSYYLPDGIEYMTHNGNNYIVTANEGDDYDYSDMISWKEEMRGREFVEKNMTADNLSEEMKTWLASDTMLGRLTFTTQNGESSVTTGYSKFVMLGSRSFSIWNVTSMKQVYDSGDDIEMRHAYLYPDLFNGDVNGTNTPTQDADKTSPGRGPQPESVSVGAIDRLTLIFIGNESPGTVNVYSILEGIRPRFECIWAGVRNTSLTWSSMFTSEDMRGVAPEHIIFLPKDKSPTGKEAVIVMGTKSGSVTLLNVVLTGTVPPASQASGLQTSLLLLSGILILHEVMKMRF
ncbi:mesenchyme-specific cell surface glycoprotein-like [Haliotis rubra]|uniref:mesenchyme-specific cell surface glycoprotein-like n=1 Tax=Haliotis rubra TaxID=36100 RepID=UPI001EE58930|nr:mesenchyme-specific cell surface glycoprotein-like [Haliotis rubra]XP_046585251.1 mesenchyme-specific cell surface glycoprotein-like [Haliotis rubra]XP_046585252.1 mesenchyme-specific cell surface glycoprotein-like [Haliotis rubra]XP_046585253.1 mesenchyme-specific cell surface glycoprotein-like [Haliotis rubra]XP_046585254.1 mesenchyme-specific cell surface glycoprotein-like [Haliotis rubra]XP_046585255.1 mesenchyme-specific cell surface glycoprotein-like [Haliotis rubra]XP_046585256.1 me